MHRAFSFAFIAALAACGQTPSTAEAPDAPPVIEPFDLHIEIGRYGVMLSHVHALTNPEDGAAAVDGDPSEPRALARVLRETAWEYNIERSRLCARGVQPEASCGPAFNPVWLADPADADVSLEELQTRANALGEAVMPLWNAICEDARSRVTDEQEKRYVCAIE